MTVLDSSRAILERAEELVVGHTIRCSSTLLREVLDTLLHGPWFVMSGFEALLLLAVRCVATIAFVFFLLVVVSLVVDGGFGPWSGLLWAATAFGGGAVILGLPSKVDARSVKQAHVDELATLILKQAPDIAIRLIREGVDGVQDVSLRRTTAARWILGLIWALLVWIATRWVLEADVPEQAKITAATYLLMGVVTFFLMGAIVASYQNAQNRLRQTLRFAFLEAESRSCAADLEQSAKSRSQTSSTSLVRSSPIYQSGSTSP